jgi:hypothetical protein
MHPLRRGWLPESLLLLLGLLLVMMSLGWRKSFGWWLAARVHQPVLQRLLNVLRRWQRRLQGQQLVGEAVPVPGAGSGLLLAWPAAACCCGDLSRR